MNMRIGSLRRWSPWLLALAAAAAPAPAQQDPAQQDPEAMERLRRDQEEILRKAERLHGMMQRLQQRYEREQKPEQVKLLQEGVAHLERSGLLREVAGIRDDIAASAYAEALRKQKEVVTDLERLIDILLERKSMASLDADLAQVAEQARSARELEERQRALRDRTAEAVARHQDRQGATRLQEGFQLWSQSAELAPEAGVHPPQARHILGMHFEVAEPVGRALGAPEGHQHQGGGAGQEPLGRPRLEEAAVVEAPGPGPQLHLRGLAVGQLAGQRQR